MFVNRPDNDDLRCYQERVKSLEEELLHYRSTIKQGVMEYMTNEKLLQVSL